MTGFGGINRRLPVFTFLAGSKGPTEVNTSVISRPLYESKTRLTRIRQNHLAPKQKHPRK